MSFYISNLNVNDYNVPDLFRMFDLDYRAPPADPNVLKYKLFEKYQEFKTAPHISEMQKYRLMEFLKQAYQRIAFYKPQQQQVYRQPQVATSPFLQQQQQLTANPYYNRPNNVNPYQMLNPYNTINTINTIKTINTPNPYASSNIRTQIPHQTNVNYNFSPNFYNKGASIGLGTTVMSQQRTPEITKTVPYKPVETLPQKYAAGDLNVLQKKTILKTLNIDTLFRANFFSTKSTNCLIELPSPIKNVVSMKVTSIELPNTVYTFNVMNKTNVFSVVIEGIKYCIYINEGNYTADELVAYLNEEIFGGSNAPIPDFSNIQAEFDSKYGKFVFRRADDAKPAFKFDLDFTLPDYPDRSITLNMGWMLGYRKAQYVFDDDYNKVATTAKKVGFNPEGIYNSIGFKYLFMSVNEFKNNYNETIIPVFTNNSSLPIRDILARLVVSSDKNSIVFDDSSDLVLKKREYFGPVVIDRLKVVLYDELGREVNLINMDYSFTVELECLYS
jgi:hypothetical protein